MMKIVGHRGAEGYAPENTLLSFQTAIDIGCDRTELDVRLSKDGEAIVMHDAEVSRTTNGHGRVDGLTLAELKTLECAPQQKIPTLQEVIDLCKGKIDLQIELKADGTPAKVNELVTKDNILSHVIVSSFDIELIKEIKRINPSIRVLYLVREFDQSVLDLIKIVSLEYVGLRSTVITKSMVNDIHQLGAKVYAYRVDDTETGQRLTGIGVDDIGTSFPKMFLKK